MNSFQTSGCPSLPQSVCLSLPSSSCLFFCLPVSPSLRMSGFLFLSPSVYPSLRLSVSPSVCLSLPRLSDFVVADYLSVCLFVYISCVHRVGLTKSLFVCVSAQFFVGLYVCLHAC